MWKGIKRKLIIIKSIEKIRRYNRITEIIIKKGIVFIVRKN